MDWWIGIIQVWRTWRLVWRQAVFPAYLSACWCSRLAGEANKCTEPEQRWGFSSAAPRLTGTRVAVLLWRAPGAPRKGPRAAQSHLLRMLAPRATRRRIWALWFRFYRLDNGGRGGLHLAGSAKAHLGKKRNTGWSVDGSYIFKISFLLLIQPQPYFLKCSIISTLPCRICPVETMSSVSSRCSRTTLRRRVLGHTPVFAGNGATWAPAPPGRR